MEPVKEVKDAIVSSVLVEYQPDKSDKDLQAFRATQKCLDVVGISDEVKRAFVLSKNKAFMRDLHIQRYK